MIVGTGQSNATLKKEAEGHTTAAEQASAAAEDGKGSHSRAEQLQHTAAYAHERAGNATKAKAHREQAAKHTDLAQAERTAKYAANDISRQAETMSRKAALKEYGDEPDPEYGAADKSTQAELHAKAQALHEKAASAHKAAGSTRESQYHADKAKEHALAASVESSSASPEEE